MTERGLDPDSIELTQIDTEADAQSAGFVGSPTIRVDGEDIQPPGEAPIGLTCRVYRRPGGGVSPLPDPADVRAALDQGLLAGGSDERVSWRDGADARREGT